MPLAGVNADGSGEADGLIFASKDEGKTWSKLGGLGLRCDGANILHLKSGELLAAITYQGERKPGDPVQTSSGKSCSTTWWSLVRLTAARPGATTAA